MSQKKPPSDLIQYSAAGIQMVVIICLFVFGGRKLDQHFETAKPWWTLGLAIFGVIVSLIYMLNAFNKISKK